MNRKLAQRGLMLKSIPLAESDEIEQTREIRLRELFVEIKTRGRMGTRVARDWLNERNCTLYTKGQVHRMLEADDRFQSSDSGWRVVR